MEYILLLDVAEQVTKAITSAVQSTYGGALRGDDVHVLDAQLAGMRESVVKEGGVSEARRGDACH